MKEIKLRSWNKVNKSMIYYTLVDLISIIDSCNLNKNICDLVYLTDHNRSPNTMMQYVGKKDMDGMPIYEGDIIYKEICAPDDPAYGYYGTLGVVETDPDNMGWCIVSVDDDNAFYDHGTNFTFHEIRVIGNIYEHPTLIENRR